VSFVDTWTKCLVTLGAGKNESNLLQGDFLSLL